MAQVPRLQDRGRREREGTGQVGVVLDARRKGLIKRVVAGRREIRDLLTREQKAFIDEAARHRIDFDRLVVLGALRAHRREVDDPACPWRITAELWIRADGERMMEASIKAPAVQAAVAVAGFMAFLAEVGAERDKEQQSKTRWALSYCAGRKAAAARQGASVKSKSGFAAGR